MRGRGGGTTVQSTHIQHTNTPSVLGSNTHWAHQKKLEKKIDVGGFYYMVFLNPCASTLQILKVFSTGKEFWFKSILTGHEVFKKGKHSV